MSDGGWLEWSALLLALIALAAAMAKVGNVAPPFARLRAHALALSVALTLAAIGLLAYYFLVGRLDVEYVFLYTRTDYPIYLKIVGVWGAQKGTILLWTALMGLCIAWFEFSPLLRGGFHRADSRLRDWTMLFALAIYVAFLTLVVRQDTFSPTADFFLASRPIGNGLNPVLQSPYSLVHPPAEFIGYALTTIPAAAALAHLASGKPGWSRLVRGWTRVAWGAYTLALGMGAIWAYYTLSFGGFWAWDPVEVANLIPWLVLTAFLHARVENERTGKYGALAPLLAFGTLWFSLFATFATRSGLWVSVHAFTDPTGTFAKDPALRLVNIVSADPQTAAIMGIMGTLFFGFLGLSASRFSAAAPLLGRALSAVCFAAAGAFAVAPATALGAIFELLSPVSPGGVGPAVSVALALLVALAFAPSIMASASDDGSKRRGRLFSMSALAYTAILLIGASLLITLTMDLSGANGMNREVFDAWAPVVVLPSILAIVAFLGHRTLADRPLASLVIISGALGMAAAVLFPQHWPLGLTMPALLVGLVVGVHGLLGTTGPRSDGSGRRAGALVSIVLGLGLFVFFANPPDTVLVAGWALESDALLQTLGLALAVGLLIVMPHVLAKPTETSRLPLAGRVARTLRPASLQLAHIAVVLVLIGYAWSVYAASETRSPVTLARGESVELGPYVLTYDSTSGEYDPAHGFQTSVTAKLIVAKEGARIGRAEVHMFWIDQVTHYDPATRVSRLGIDDLYIASLAMCRDPTARCIDNDAWIGAHESGITPLAANESITAMAFTPKVIPFMGFVWAGFGLGLLSMALLVLAGGGGSVGARAALPGVAVRARAEARERRLEEALIARSHPWEDPASTRARSPDDEVRGQ
ncbi:MAG: cytochrome c biogenesis protein CcsA [Euryarchaeota archaeon]|nr:cytochrome c biogenesis protein CcsA [Euryarchaeota archaeon]